MKVGVFPIINNTHACCLLSFPPSSSLPPLVYLARSGSPSRAFPSLHTHSPRPVPLPPSVARSPLTATSLARPPPPSSPIHLSSLPVFLFPAATTGLRHVFAGDEPTRYAPPRPSSSLPAGTAPNPIVSYSCSDLTQLLQNTCKYAASAPAGRHARSRAHLF